MRLNATPGRLPVIEQVLEEARQHVWQVVTSTVSVAEMAFAATRDPQTAARACPSDRVDELLPEPLALTLVSVARERYIRDGCGVEANSSH